ncbi:hypothetical protein HDU76_001479 [Blyttiomyces sp. JEL0837]|nr:hypothetical protein HDU76_001479 [Blyttiomyces sp. JEL0837]
MINPSKTFLISELGGDAADFANRNCNEFNIGDFSMMIPNTTWGGVGPVAQDLWNTVMIKPNGFQVHYTVRSCLVWATKLVTYGRYWQPWWGSYGKIDAYNGYINYKAPGVCQGYIGLTPDALMGRAKSQYYG